MNNPIRVSEGAMWVIKRMPDTVFPDFQEELVDAMTTIMHKYGYNVGIAIAFRENSPFHVERSK